MGSQVACINLTLTYRKGFTYPGLRRQDELAENLAGFEQPVARGDLGQGQDPIDDRPQPAGAKQLHEREKTGFTRHGRAQDAELAPENVAEVQLRLEPRGRAA